jgi:hypothetical protein
VGALAADAVVDALPVLAAAGLRCRWKLEGRERRPQV